MGRKSREQGFQEFQQLRNYQWEFLRRNSEYRRDFEKFMEQFGDWFKEKGFWYQLTCLGRWSDFLATRM